MIHDALYDRWEMYNLAKDPVEMNNIVGKHPLIRKRLESSLKEWAVEFDHHWLWSNREGALSLSQEELDSLRALGYIQ